MDGIARDIGDAVAVYINDWARDGFPDHGDTMLVAGSYAITSKAVGKELALEVLVPQSLIEMMAR